MNREIPFFSFSKVPDAIREEWVEAVRGTIGSNQFVSGKFVRQFENEWAATIGVSEAIGVANGLDGLLLALKALGVGQGDFVGVPSHTFIATWNAVKLAGAEPVCIDVDQRGLIDIKKLKSTQIKLKAVIPVHMHGMMVEMNEVMKWAQFTSTYVIEDASQAHMAHLNGRFAGSFGQLGVFSLYPTKNLGALGDAGVITSNDPTLANKVRQLANYGSSLDNKYEHLVVGHNSRLDSIQAAILLVNLRYLRSWNIRRSEIASLYLKRLSSLTGIKFLSSLENSVWHHVPIVTKRRDEIRQFLLENGIHTEIHYPHLAANEYSKIFGTNYQDKSSGEIISKTILSLPISPWHTDEEIEFVSEKILLFFASQS